MDNVLPIVFEYGSSYLEAVSGTNIIQALAKVLNVCNLVIKKNKYQIRRQNVSKCDKY